MTAAPEFTPTHVPARIADLAFTYLCPANFHVVQIPDERPDFDQPTSFFPLQVVMANFGAVLFSAVARPAYADGTVQDWAEFLARQEKLEIVSLRPGVLGGLPCVMIEVLQPSDAGVMRMRTALLEDGKRLVNVSIMAPDAIWPSVEPTLQMALSSFRLAEPRGTSTPLMRSDVKPAETPPAAAAPAGEPTAAPVAAPESEPVAPAVLALADDTASLDPDLPFNVRLRDSGAGLIPRVLETNPAEKSVVIGAGAVAATFKLPFGWHVLDDGKRTLVFDAGGKIQISLNLRRDDGDARALLAGILAQAREDQPAIDPLLVDFSADLPGLVLRNYRDGDDVLVQAFLVKHLRDDGLAHVARVTASPDDMSRAMNLVEIILRSLGLPVAAA
ncbi:MAG: hypothetical protein JNL92_17995 [Opitutaceae bacterium]|nr:hypothetical protein [Opitutaceae bacterium]